MTLEERVAYEQWMAGETHRLVMGDVLRAWALVESGRSAIPLVPALARSPTHRVRKLMIGAMWAISLGLVALSCVHVPFWTSLDWVTR